MLTELARAWRDERGRLLESAEAIVNQLRSATGADGAAADRAPVAGLDAIDSGINGFVQSFDVRRGGFGGAPKFPRPSELLFLMNAHATGGPRAKWRSTRCARGSADCDHVGGRFTAIR